MCNNHETPVDPRTRNGYMPSQHVSLYSGEVCQRLERAVLTPRLVLRDLKQPWIPPCTPDM